MAHSNSISIGAHRSIYNDSNHRDLSIEFSIPEEGTNAKTGLLILVPGFGANIDSKVYTKMRNEFADQYNLITIQCSYFGEQFMQTTEKIILKDPLEKIFSADQIAQIHNNESSILKMIMQNDTKVYAKAKLDESEDEFADLSFMQCIDIITAIEAVQLILEENKLAFDKARIIGYGHSQGAYLLHLCNKMSSMFSYIIDNSAWLEPLYLNSNQTRLIGNQKLIIEYDYFAKDRIKNKKNLNLFEVYKDFKNDTQIVTFQGNKDELIDHNEKRKFINDLNNTQFILIEESDVDHIKYKSNTHGLDADFLELFKYAMSLEQPSENNVQERRTEFQMRDLKFTVDYSQGLPVFNVKGII